MQAFNSRVHPDDELWEESSQESLHHVNQKTIEKVERWLSTLDTPSPGVAGQRTTRPAAGPPTVLPGCWPALFASHYPTSTPTAGQSTDESRPNVNAYSAQAGYVPSQAGRATPIPSANHHHDEVDPPQVPIARMSVVAKRRNFLPGNTFMLRPTRPAPPPGHRARLPPPKSAASQSAVRVKGNAFSTANATAGYAGGQSGVGREKAVYGCHPGGSVRQDGPANRDAALKAYYGWEDSRGA